MDIHDYISNGLDCHLQHIEQYSNVYEDTNTHESLLVTNTDTV